MNNSNNKKYGLILVIVGVVIILCALVFTFLFNNNDKKKEEDEVVDISTIDINGVYEYKDLVVKIYKTKEYADELFPRYSTVRFSIGSNYAGFLEMDNNKGISNMFDEEITFIFKKDKIDIKFSDTAKENNDIFKDGTFVKTKNYSAEDFYKENVGDIKFVDSNYNGIFESNGKELFIFQLDESSVYMTLIASVDDSVSIYGTTLNIQTDGSLKDEEAIESESITASLKDNSIELSFASRSDFSGEYVKKAKLTIDDIIPLY